MIPDATDETPMRVAPVGSLGDTVKGKGKVAQVTAARHDEERRRGVDTCRHCACPQYPERLQSEHHLVPGWVMYLYDKGVRKGPAEGQ